ASGPAGGATGQTHGVAYRESYWGLGCGAPTVLPLLLGVPRPTRGRERRERSLRDAAATQFRRGHLYIPFHADRRPAHRRRPLHLVEKRLQLHEYAEWAGADLAGTRQPGGVH